LRLLLHGLSFFELVLLATTTAVHHGTENLAKSVHLLLRCLGVALEIML
jgi:hypothetical protein